MEYSLRQFALQFAKFYNEFVLILILMEYSLRQEQIVYARLNNSVS